MVVEAGQNVLRNTAEWMESLLGAQSPPELFTAFRLPRPERANNALEGRREWGILENAHRRVPAQLIYDSYTFFPLGGKQK
jgi:hypothetical protein